MLEIKDYEFGSNCNIYVKDSTGEYSCYGFDYYLNHKEKFQSREVIVAPKTAPVHFRIIPKGE